MVLMWKWKEEERPAAQPAAKPTPLAAASPSPAAAAAKISPPSLNPKEVRPVESPKAVDSYRADVAHIGKSVVVKGELSGSEDLYLDGEVEGTIELNEHSLTVGPNGRLKATVRARDVVVHGKVDGNIHAGERVELKRTAILAGDIVTQRIVIEDGAMFKGGIDIQRPAARPEGKREAAAAASSGASAATPVQLGSLLESK
jgi:cytoskeletal protein CcmA (bactofilin family)